MAINLNSRALIQEFHLNVEDLNQQLEKCIIEEMNRTGPHKQGHSNIGGWQSERDLHTQGDETIISKTMLKLLDSFSPPITHYLKKYHECWNVKTSPNYKWDYTAVWFNVAVRGSYNAPHIHPPSAISGAYYIRTEEPTPEYPFSGRIDFYCDNEGTYYFPKAGTLLLFPGTMMHFVHPYYGSGYRICLSFNTSNLQGIES